MTETETPSTEPGAGALPVPPQPPADPGTSAPVPDPLDCPHIRTGADLVGMRPEGQKVETAITHAADWVSRNAPSLYTLAQALDILRGLFRKVR